MRAPVAGAAGARTGRWRDDARDAQRQRQGDNGLQQCGSHVQLLEK
jgi:hypothetical protein